MSGRYVIEHGDVWLEPETDPRRPVGFRRNTHVCSGSEELAVAIVDDTMVKCGKAESVEAWVSKHAGFFEVTIVRFSVSPETVAELNACVANRNRASILVERLTEIGMNNPALVAAPRCPR